ncbi:hypothetical protein [Corynebacterium frankenforstense]
MDFLLQINEIVQGPIKDLLIRFGSGTPQLPYIDLAPRVTLPENVTIGDIGSSFGENTSSAGDVLSQLSSGDDAQ